MICICRKSFFMSPNVARRPTGARAQSILLALGLTLSPLLSAPGVFGSGGGTPTGLAGCCATSAPEQSKTWRLAEAIIRALGRSIVVAFTIAPKPFWRRWNLFDYESG